MDLIVSENQYLGLCLFLVGSSFIAGLLSDNIINIFGGISFPMIAAFIFRSIKQGELKWK